MSDSVIKADVNKSPAFCESNVIKTNPIVLPVVFQPSVYGSHSFIPTHPFKAEVGAPIKNHQLSWWYDGEPLKAV
jgi:hypothetical protein